MPVQVTQLGERLDEEILPLVATESSDADQVTADGPGGGSDQIDPGPGDVHPAGRGRALRSLPCRRSQSGTAR